MINRIHVAPTYPRELSDICTLYFILFALFYKHLCNSTVWTLGYVVPYHANLLYQNKKIAYGILSMQAKESKHSGIKQELKPCTNRAKIEGNKNKWHQIMRPSYVRNFYLPYHFPVKIYQTHYDSRNLKTDKNLNNCITCYHVLNDENEACRCCCIFDRIVDDVHNGKLPDIVIAAMLPVICNEYSSRFADNIQLSKHKCENGDKIDENIVPQNLTVSQLKKILADRNELVTGNKQVLMKRLEALLQYDMELYASFLIFC